MTRTLTALAVLALTAVLAFFGWGWFQRERTIAEQRRVIAQLEARLDRVWKESLVADLRVDAVRRDPATGRIQTAATFVQYEPGTETPLFERSMVLEGAEVYVDVLVVKFERPLVEAGDGLRGRSLLLFRRAFGDGQTPASGVPLWRGADGAEVVPEIARLAPRPSAFERRIWERFWRFANDPTAAAAAGIRVAQGEAPHVKAVPGQVYKLTLRASGGLDIAPRLPGAVLKASVPGHPGQVTR